MGVKTILSLKKAQQLFKGYCINVLESTNNGVVDTTYLTENYVIKKYEREVAFEEDKHHLAKLLEQNLYVPHYITSRDGWHLYTRLQGKICSKTPFAKVVNLARFLRTYHQLLLPSSRMFFDVDSIKDNVKQLKKQSYFYYKKFNFILEHLNGCDGFIHGDIFYDNTVWNGKKIGIFDFIDGGCGRFSFDVAVTLLGFKILKSKTKMQLFLQIYNYRNKKKLEKKVIIHDIKVAVAYYGMLRITHQHNQKKAKELLCLFESLQKH